jgi:hypothetical protein
VASADLFKMANDQLDQGVSPNVIGRLMRKELIEDGATPEQAEGHVSSWLEHVFAVSEQDLTEPEVDTEGSPATLPESEVQVEPEVPVEEWELKQGQELREAEGDLPTRITRVGKRDVKYKVDPKKKYSMIDPEAEPLTGETSESESKQTRSGTDSESTDSADSGGRD